MLKQKSKGDYGALGTAATDDGTSQWDVENSCSRWSSSPCTVSAAGSGYTGNSGTHNYTCAIDGDGSGGVCTVHVVSEQISHM